MKKLINDPRLVVREMLEGAVALAPGQALLADETVVVRRPLPDGDAGHGGKPWPVAVISGGGSGHEPAHAGFVGTGMLAAAVAGNVFTSPGVDGVLAGLRAVGTPAGALLIVKNYTGDRLNFGLAAEMARAEGIPVEVVVVADDVALRDTVERAQRRGIAGTVLVHKVAGAAAAAGLPLAGVAALARRAAEGVGSMGVALGGCTLPAAAGTGFALAEDEIELGLGIHGEPGVSRTHMRSADELAELMVAAIAADAGLEAGDRVALLVNGLGATPAMELDIVLRAALRTLRARGMEVARAWRGTLLSALDMPGCSISVMRLDDELTRLLDAPTDAPAWPGPGRVNDHAVLPGRAAPEPASAPSGDALPPEGQALRTAALAAAHALLAHEAVLTELDAKTGDGDLGASMARAARAIMDLPPPAWGSPAVALAAMGDAIRRSVGGSSGPFYATALMRASRRLAADAPPNAPPNAAAWADAFALAVDAVCGLGGAQPGDRTMVDALRPAADALSDALASGMALPGALCACAAAAAGGADATAAMLPRLGRSSYIGERALGTPDGGAVAVQVWLGAACQALADVAERTQAG
jgi:ATP-dependent dihydroxyacetone kinase